MSNKLTLCAAIEQSIWVSQFFTGITIVLVIIAVLGMQKGKLEWMHVDKVFYFGWQKSTIKVESHGGDGGEAAIGHGTLIEDTGFSIARNTNFIKFGEDK